MIFVRTREVEVWIMRSQRAAWAAIGFILIVAVYIAAVFSSNGTLVVEGQSAVTVTVEPTWTGGIPTVVATDCPREFPTLNATDWAAGTVTIEPWGGGSTPTIEPSPTS